MVQLNLGALKNSPQDDNVSDRYESYNEFSDILLEQEIKKSEEKNSKPNNDFESFIEPQQKIEPEIKKETIPKKLVSLKHLGITPKNNKDNSTTTPVPETKIINTPQTENIVEKQNKVSLKHLGITPAPKKEIPKEEIPQEINNIQEQQNIEPTQKQTQEIEAQKDISTNTTITQTSDTTQTTITQNIETPKKEEIITQQETINPIGEKEEKKEMVTPPEEKQQEKKFTITDGDTNCEFSHTVETEFFVNYVATYETNNSKRELKEGKVITLEEKNITPEETKIRQPKRKIELTNLKIYLSNIKLSKKQYIGIITSFLFILTIAGGTTGYNYYNKSLKSSIIQTQNTIKNENKITKTNKNNIVKENSKNTVDNNDLKDKITQNKQKVLEQLQKQKQQKLFKDFLINKYGYTTNKN